jgi:hypothetical protein
MEENKEIEFTWQEIELLQTLLRPIAEDTGNSNLTRKVAINIILKLEKSL